MKTKLALAMGVFLCVAPVAITQELPTIRNAAMTVSMRAGNDSYEIESRKLGRPVLISRVAAQIDHEWIYSTDYPVHRVAESTFEDEFGHGGMLAVTFGGLANKPDLICLLRLYDDQSYGDISVTVRNTTGAEVTVQAIRMVDATGEPRIDLGPSEANARLMLESYTDNPSLKLLDLSRTPPGAYFGARSALIYNTKSQQSLLLAALTSQRFLTLLHMKVARSPSDKPRILSLTVDSTGTTEAALQRDSIASGQQTELSLPVSPGKELASECLLFAAGGDYHAQLEAYGNAVRRLHHARVSSKAPVGWWSWTAFYGGITQGEALTNAMWLAEHLKALGYNYLHIDEGYDYARGEYITANATQFPDGMTRVGRRVCGLGLNLGIWTAPFEVSARSRVYERHKDWLVCDSQGKPIMIGYVDANADPLYVLDTTNLGAEEYLRRTYRVLTREWGVRYIKLDFMDSSAIEGHYYRPHTTALEAQRIGLRIIRQAVGEDVLLDKDGSPVLNSVGIVDEGRISPDTGHTFGASKEAAIAFAGRYYMNRNFFIDDPDAFTVSRQLIPDQVGHDHESNAPLSLNEAQVSIVLAAMAGGMFEIGDDLPTLGSEPDRLALVENTDLLQIVQLGRAAVPRDLMSYRFEDEQPSVFFLHEDQRQSMLAVYNWTEQARSHMFTLASLKLPGTHPFRTYDVFNHDKELPLEGGQLRLKDQPPHSVRLIKLVDESVPAAPPSISVQVPQAGLAGRPLALSADAHGSAVPALSFHWELGDGTEASGARIVHTYTRAGTFPIKLTVDGMDGVAAHKSLIVTIKGFPSAAFDLGHNHHFAETNDH